MDGIQKRCVDLLTFVLTGREFESLGEQTQQNVETYMRAIAAEIQGDERAHKLLEKYQSFIGYMDDVAVTWRDHDIFEIKSNETGEVVKGRLHRSNLNEKGELYLIVYRSEFGCQYIQGLPERTYFHKYFTDRGMLAAVDGIHLKISFPSEGGGWEPKS